MASLEDRLKQHGLSLGFDLVGITRATEADGFGRLREWLAQGFAGEMDYMERHGEARRHPAALGARFRPPGRPRLVRQEHHAPAQETGQLLFPRRAVARCRADS